jgi:hypothetical protein
MLKGNSDLSEESALVGAITPKAWNRRGLTLPIPFKVDLGSAETEQTLAWRILPGTNTADWFVADTDFAGTNIPTTPTVWTSAASRGFQQVFINEGGYQAFRRNFGGGSGVGLFSLPAIPTGVHLSALGAWITFPTLIQRYYDNTFGAMAFDSTSIDGLTDVRKPFEYNGFLWFSARVRNTESTPVIGFLETFIFGEDPTNPVTYQYFSVENLGTGGQVGLYQGQLVVVTNRGVWSIVAGDETSAYKLGGQLQAWDLGDLIEVGITNEMIVVLDKSLGNLLKLTPDGQSLYPRTRFTKVASDGDRIVMSAPTEVGISNGTSVQTFDELTATGTMIRRPDHSAYWLPWSRPLSKAANVSVTLETTELEFDSIMRVSEILVSSEVTAIEVYTNFRFYPLKKPQWNPALWKCGFPARTIKLRMTVPAGKRVIPPQIFLSPRSSS